jgi:hypothetical protein
MKRISAAGLGLAVVLSASQADAALIPVTACGTVVSGRAELLGDLDCSTYPGSAVVLVGRSQLRLNGFTITANTSMQDVDVAGIQCVSTIPGKKEICKIHGPGTIVGGTIGIDGGMKPCISDVTVAGAGTVGVLGGSVMIRHSVIQNNGGLAVQYDGGGVRASAVSLRDCDVSGNAEHGVWANGGRLRLVKSSVTGNGTAPGCATEPNLCADLVSYATPQLMGSTCETSTRPNNTTHGVCSND